jgi:hypothetical protein
MYAGANMGHPSRGVAALLLCPVERVPLPLDWKTCNYGVVVKWAALVAVELPPM